MKKCPFCGHDNEEQAKSCNHCKAEIPHEETKETSPVKGAKKRNKE
jgi:uncharacterized membrane protein YvbJ